MMTRYTPTAIALHWIIAVVMAGTFALGLYMQGLPLSPSKLQFYSYHKWAGVSAFLLVLVRLIWRMGHPAPAMPGAMSSAMQRVAGAAHTILYLLMLAIPISGWLMSSAKGFQTVWFGVIPLPDLVARDKTLGEQLHLLHQILNYSTLLLLIGHVFAAFKHHLVDRDDVLIRMLPWASSQHSSTSSEKVS